MDINGFSIITIARKDTVIQELPPIREKGTRGRKKIKGEKIKLKLGDLKEERTLNIYGKEVKVRYK